MSRSVFRAFALLSLGASVASAAPRPASRAGGPVFLNSCAVMFGVRSSGTSETRAGLFGNAMAGEKRTDFMIQRIFILTGYDSTAFQRIADRLCGDAPAALTAAGYQVLQDSAKTHFIWADRDSIGQRSPQEQKLGDTRYLVYSRSGTPIIDPMVVGGLSGPKLQGWEATIAKQYGLRPVNVLYTVDFATIEAETGRRLLGLARADVSAKLQLTVGAMVTSIDASDAKCSRGAPFGKHKTREFCLVTTKMLTNGTYQTADEEEKAFRDPIASVKETTTGGQKLAGAVSGLTNALGAALGNRRGTLVDIDQFDVAVDMAKYEARAVEGAGGLLPTAMAAIENPSLRKGKKK